MGILGFSSDIAALDDETKQKFKKYIDVFKANIKERSKYVCALLTPPATIGDASSVAAFRFADFDFGKSIIKLFRIEGVGKSFIIEPVGVLPDGVYEIDNCSEKKVLSGRDIIDFGLLINVDDFYSVKTVVMKRI